MRFVVRMTYTGSVDFRIAIVLVNIISTWLRPLLQLALTLILSTLSFVNVDSELGWVLSLYSIVKWCKCCENVHYFNQSSNKWKGVALCYISKVIWGPNIAVKYSVCVCVCACAYFAITLFFICCMLWCAPRQNLPITKTPNV